MAEIKKKATSTLTNTTGHGLFFTPEIKWHNVLFIYLLPPKKGWTY